jgi:hypothetical protein
MIEGLVIVGSPDRVWNPVRGWGGAGLKLTRGHAPLFCFKNLKYPARADL